MMTNKQSWQEYFHIRDLRLYDPSISSIQHHILLFLKTCMNKEGECYWGIDSIATKTGWSKRTIKSAMKILTQKGYLIIRRKGGRGPKDTNWYALNSSLLQKIWAALISIHKSAPAASFLGINYPQGCNSEQLSVQDTTVIGAGDAPEDINKDIKEVFISSKTAEQGRNLLPDHFQPNDEHVFLAKMNELDLFERLKQFRAFCKGQRKKSYDWDEEFKGYLLGSFKRKKLFK